jgi:hypothetical protein
VKKREKLGTVRRVYPRAITTSDSVDALFDLLEDRFDLEPQQIMLADSICSDDVNTIEYPQRAYEMLGPFKMGGLNGFPFTGLTGMGAFAGHVPDDGAVMVYYAPHIGVSRSGAVGELLRIGQSKPSGCCGAARAALKRLEDGLIQPGVVTELDYQMNTIEQIFLRHGDRILAADNRLQVATEIMYDAIHVRILELAAQTKYRCRYLILVGAILINADHDMGSFTEPRHFTVRDLHSGIDLDVMADYMGRMR